MGINIDYRSKGDDFKSMVKRLEAVNGLGVEVGVLQGEQKWLAAIHEYGLDIEVTDKMRKYLATQGLHLRKDTTHIHIPERSFLRTGYDKSRDELAEKVEQMLIDVYEGRMDAEALLKGVGLELSSAIKDYAVELSVPANHPFTIEQKGSSNPLVDTGDMIGGITWRKA